MVTGTIAAVEKGDTEGPFSWKIRGEGRVQFVQIGWIETEGEGLLAIYEEVGLESMLDKLKTAFENSPVQVILMPVS